MTLKTRTGIILFAVFSFAALLCAEPVSKLTPSNYVNDFAHVLSDSTAANLNALCKQVDEKAHAQIAVVTVKSLDGEDVESYAVDLFKKWGIGSKASDHGVLILLASDDRKYRVEVGYGLEPILPDGKVGDIGRQAVPLLRKGDYDAALSQMTWQVADVIAKDANVQLNTSSRPPPVPQEREQPQGGLSLGAIIGLIVIGALVLFTPFGRVLLWSLLLGGMGGGRGGGGWGGGGGFGGGGGGFGGFGGGSSGGGGASGSW